MSDTTILVLLSLLPLVIFLTGAAGIVIGVHYWAKPRRQAKR